MLDGPLPVAVVCHDAGAANLLIAELTHSPAAPDWVLPVMEGPARRLWEAAGAPFGPPQPLDAALARAQAVVSAGDLGSVRQVHDHVHRDLAGVDL